MKSGQHAEAYDDEEDEVTCESAVEDDEHKVLTRRFQAFSGGARGFHSRFHFSDGGWQGVSNA